MDTSIASTPDVISPSLLTNSSSTDAATQAQQDAFNRALAAAQLGTVSSPDLSTDTASSGTTQADAVALVCNSIIQQVIQDCMNRLDENRKENETDDD